MKPTNPQSLCYDERHFDVPTLVLGNPHLGPDAYQRRHVSAGNIDLTTCLAQPYI